MAKGSSLNRKEMIKEGILEYLEEGILEHLEEETQKEQYRSKYSLLSSFS